jgi:hypothetical protein
MNTFKAVWTQFDFPVPLLFSEPHSRVLRVSVVDDHELVRKGICAIVVAEPSMTICGEASDGVDGVEKAGFYVLTS